MSRSRKVEPEAAISAAMALFWTNGFGSLGTRQIEEKTGITRFTLQTTYGGKMKLFLTALDAYLDVFEASDLLSIKGGDLDSIAGFFEKRGTPGAMPEIACQGCFMLNSMIEFSSRNAEVNERADRYFEMLRQWFTSALERSKSDGSLSVDIEIEDLAHILLNAALGLNAVIRAQGDYSAGEKMAFAISKLVKSWASEVPRP